MMPSIAITVDTSVRADLDRVFAHIVPIDLTSIFTGYGPLPAVIGTRDQSGSWDAPGQTRTVLLSDGSTARERLNRYRAPIHFSYTVSHFTGILRHIAESADGEWWFTEVTPGRITIKWRYALNGKSILGLPILWLIAKIVWRGYMRKVLDQCVSQIQSSY
jgi:hypothetical protein